ncbi:MAG TPA: hypothetical protein VIT43_15910, partial [Candidatus Dormibacteraeota bacterium]
MMADANREIRMMERLAEERRRRPSRTQLLHHLDSLIEELEEMNLASCTEIPADMFGELDGLRRYLPQAGVPASWPATVNDLLEVCFRLQSGLLSTGPVF